MTDKPDDRLTVADRINRLFDVFRRRDESEQSVEAVAESISAIIEHKVAPTYIRQLRSDPTVDADPHVMAGLARHFGVPGEYLTTWGRRADEVDKQLRFLVAARDAGVRHLALRGGLANATLDDVVGVLKQLPPE
ncbi:hypothetical protein ABIA30_004037 [Mycobacterium sp. MAA66]|uniref:hypothetical protein n=1 Tax=Mycobacterium sp. MAA66 TaxID=3156297 RepID=UPI003517333B